MKTRKKAPADVKSDPPISQSPASDPAEDRDQAPQSDGMTPKVFRLLITPDGKIAWDRMRESTKGELKELLSRPDVQKFAGIGGDAKPVEVISPEWVDRLYDMLGVLESTAFVKIGGISPEVAKSVFTYSQAEKDTLREPTAKVINKYATAWMIRFQDEIALGFLLGSITMVKVQAAIMLSKLGSAKSASATPERAETVSSVQ
jgi:hypothetical protein